MRINFVLKFLKYALIFSRVFNMRFLFFIVINMKENAKKLLKNMEI